MKLAYFNENGRFWCWAESQTPGPNDFNLSLEIDENIALWRQTYNFDTESIEIYQPTMTDSEADAQLMIDIRAEEAADTE